MYGRSVAENCVIQYGGGDYGLSLMSMLWFRAMHFTHGDDFTDPRIDILRADLRGLPPTWMVVAECDPVHDDMIALDRLHPQYGFARHKGYPTAEHLAILAERGPLPEYRQSFKPVRRALGIE